MPDGSGVSRDNLSVSTGGSSLLINVQHLARLLICLMLYTFVWQGYLLVIENLLFEP
jgi:hypothetical protein